MLKELVVSFITLFASLSTVVCCALPITLVAVGMGASLAGFLSFFPSFIVISKYKNEVFILAASLLIFSFYVYWTGRKNSCPADQRQARLCSKLRFINKIFLFASLILYVTGFFFAFIAEDIFF